MTLSNGRQVFTLFGQPIVALSDSEDLRKVSAEMYCDVVILTADAILLGLSCHYLKIEQADGTPFSENGAKLLKFLGIHCIWLPIVSSVISSVIIACFDIKTVGDISNLPGVSTGVGSLHSGLSPSFR